MAPRSFPPLGLHAELYARASVAKDKPPPPPSDSRFLRACCANTTNASACYDSLLPHAGSFHGNNVRVARAAAVVAFAWLRGFHAELRRLQPGGTGAGKVADMALQSCVSYAAEILDRKGDTLALLRRLETGAGRIRRELAKWYQDDANILIGSFRSCNPSCIDDLASVSDAAVASPVGKKAVAYNAKLHLHVEIALDLVNSIKL